MRSLQALKNELPKYFAKIWAWRFFGLYIARTEVYQSEFCNSTIFFDTIVRQTKEQNIANDVFIEITQFSPHFRKIDTYYQEKCVLIKKYHENVLDVIFRHILQ